MSARSRGVAARDGPGEGAGRTGGRDVVERRARERQQGVERRRAADPRALEQPQGLRHHRDDVIGGEHRARVIEGLRLRREGERESAQAPDQRVRHSHRLQIPFEEEGRAAEVPCGLRRLQAHRHQRMHRARGRAGVGERGEGAAGEGAREMEHHVAAPDAARARQIAHERPERVVAHRQHDDADRGEPRRDGTEREAQSGGHRPVAAAMDPRDLDARAAQGERQREPRASRPDDPHRRERRGSRRGTPARRRHGAAGATAAAPEPERRSARAPGDRPASSLSRRTAAPAPARGPRRTGAGSRRCGRS